jgi:hypothetical protein
MSVSFKFRCVAFGIAVGLSLVGLRAALGQSEAQRTQELIEQLSPAIVKIEVSGTNPDGQMSKRRGTGFIISSKGAFTLVATAAHVLGSNETDQTRNRDWLVQNGKLANRTVQIWIPDTHGSMVERKTEVTPIEVAVPGVDLVLFSIDGFGYKSLPLANPDDTNQRRRVVLLAYKAESFGLTKPATAGWGQNTNPLKYRTDVESRNGESGGPWIDVDSGRVVAVASASLVDTDGPSYDATPVTLIGGTIPMLQDSVHQADRDKGAYEKARGNLQLLKDYAQSCLPDCGYRDAALAEIASIQQNSARADQTSEQARQDEYRYAGARGNIKALQDYVQSCSVCASKAAANAEIVSIARQTCDRTFAAALDLDVPKATPPMRDTAALSDDEVQAGLSACLVMRNFSDERRYLTQAGRGYATMAVRVALKGDIDSGRVKMARGVDLWQAAAAAGSGAAMNFLGAYYNGTFNTGKLSFVQPDTQSAIDYWVKGASANSPKAMENAGIVFLFGPSDYPPIQRDVGRAQLLLTKAIQGGSTYAAAVLGKALFYGSPPEVARNVARGLEYLTKACIAGELSAKRFFDTEMNRSQYSSLLPSTRPAGCDSENASIDTRGVQAILQSPAKGSSTYWDYNASILQLIADGSSRKFYYYSPRAGLDPVGVRRGTLAFDGKRNGNKYSGSAYVFSKYCGPLAYPVIGTVSDDQRKVQFSGFVPKRSATCTIVDTEIQAFEFDLRTNGVN